MTPRRAFPGEADPLLPYSGVGEMVLHQSDADESGFLTTGVLLGRVHGYVCYRCPVQTAATKQVPGDTRPANMWDAPRGRTSEWRAANERSAVPSMLPQA